VVVVLDAFQQVLLGVVEGGEFSRIDPGQAGIG
jgi:hypothetical protein